MAIFTTLINFTAADVDSTEQPQAFPALSLDASGNLIGVIGYGGTSGDGIVYQLDKGADYATFTTLLDDTFGQNLRGPLVADAVGDLFGVTQDGATLGDGTVFELAKTATGYAAPVALATFDGANGQFPSSGLTIDAAGDLFGEAAFGGASDQGTVFEIAKTATGYAGLTTLVTFSGLNGSGPTGGLTIDASGDLFGTTTQGGPTYSQQSFSFGGGTVFEIVKTPTGYAGTPFTLVAFSGQNLSLGTSPVGPLATDADGNMFGVTNGEIFEIAKTATGYASSATVLVTFDGIDAGPPNGGLLVDAAGNLFGTAFDSQENAGIVFEIVKTATGYDSAPTILVSFDQTNGSGPQSGLTVDGAGDLFGTTVGGGANNQGTAFELQGVFTPFVTIAGTAQEGETLTADPAVGVLAYQWQELVGGNWLDLGGATGSSYVVQQADLGNQIRVQIIDDMGVVQTSGVTNDVVDTAGNQFVNDTAVKSTIGSGLFQYVYGSADSTTVDGGGEQNIYSGGTAFNTTLNAGAVQVDAGAATNTTIDGGSQYVYGIATTTSIDAGLQQVESGGSASGTTITGGGEQDLFSGASASGTTLTGNSSQYVYGATADQTEISGGSLQYLHGTATNTTVGGGGEQNVYTDGTATGTTILTAGTQVDWGTANNTAIDGGVQYVYGTANDTTVAFERGSVQFVAAGGIANNTTIDGGGTAYVFAGGDINGVTFANPSAFFEAILDVEQASAITGPISGWQAQDVIGLGDISFSAGGTTFGYSENANNSGGTLTVSDGSNVATLALLGQYSASAFALSSDGHGGTLITDPAAIQPSALATPHAA
jgi:autotransporter passenger strand-loop-strand repeat protein